jgi:transcriptional regulator with XRE-family HTH domain
MVVRTPTVRRRRLANELRRLREAADLTIEQVAESLECSSSKISRIETAQVNPTPRDVRDMLQLYKVGGERFDLLLQLAREARQKAGLYAEFRNLPFVTFADLEAAAESTSVYCSLVLPGFLQTADYARAIVRAVRLDLRAHPEEIEKRVEFRLARKARLTKDQTPRIWVVLDEAVLRRLVGGRETMRAQLDHVVELAAQPNITLQVLPFSAGAHAGIDGSFYIISFPDPADPDVVYIENTTSDLYLEDADAIRRYDQLFDRLRAAALDPDESVTFVANVAKEL